MPPTTPLRPALLIAGVTLAVTGATAIPSAADAGAPGADRDRLTAAATARQAFTPSADALTITTSAGASTYSYDAASGELGDLIATTPGSAGQRWSPGGDVVLDGGATWTTRGRDGAQLGSYARNAKALMPGWLTTGDGFVEQSPGATTPSTAVSLTPGERWRQPVAAGAGNYGPFAVSPYGTEAVVRGIKTGSSNLYLVPVRGPMTLAGQPWTFPTRDYLVSSYRPGDADVAQEPGKGIRDSSARTYIAFLGTEPGSSEASLFVDYQDGGRHLGEPLQPTRVIGAGSRCTTTAPAFSPDRRSIAYVVGVGSSANPCSQMAVRVVSLGSGGSYDAATVRTLHTAPVGAPIRAVSWRAVTAPVQQVRIGGDDRYEVGVNVSRSVYGDAGAGGAVIAGGEAYADALAGSPLSAALKGPLMLTRKDRVDARVVAELNRVLKAGAAIYVLGGPATVGEGVLAELRAQTGHPVVRIGGASRYDVAVAVAKVLATVRGEQAAAIFVANGQVFPDALVASPAATVTRGVVLLSAEDALPASTKTYIDAHRGVALYGIGGGGSRSLAGYPGVEVISGADRYEVAKRVADRFFTAEWIGTVVSGLNWADATTGGALISQWRQPILLARGATLPSWTAERLDASRAAIDLLAVFGGPASVDPAAMDEAVRRAGSQTLYHGPDSPR